jgi:hypothetical protein
VGDGWLGEAAPWLSPRSSTDDDFQGCGLTRAHPWHAGERVVVRAAVRKSGGGGRCDACSARTSSFYPDCVLYVEEIARRRQVLEIPRITSHGVTGTSGIHNALQHSCLREGRFCTTKMEH